MKQKNVYLLIFLIVGFSYGQTSTSKLIDSLNRTDNLEQRIELSKQIASELRDINWDRAIAYIELAEKDAKKTKTPELYLASIYDTAAGMYFSKDALDVTLDYYQKSYNLYKKNNDSTEVAKLENNLAIIYARGGNKIKALEYFQRVYNYQEEKNDSIQLAKILNNMGTIYLADNIDSSLYYYTKAFSITKNIQDSTLNTYIYTNLARAYSLKNDNIHAKLYFDKAIALANQSNKASEKTFIYQSVSEYFLSQNQNDSAIFYANKTLDLAKDHFYTFSNQKATGILYQAYIGLENYKKASEYFKQYDIIKDSLNVASKIVNLERLRLEQEYATRSQIRALNDEKQQFKYYVIGLILVVGILVLLILLIKYRNRIIKNRLDKKILEAKQQELRQNLDAKNKVLIGKAMTEMHRTDIINDILNDLKHVKLKAVKKETQQAIDFILKRLQKDLNTDIWQEFEVSFEQVHKSFYDELIKNHPDLTPKDRRLCSLLYLDLTTKEISQITGQSFKTVENARTRLRKKLNLTNEKVNLSTYLNSLSLS